MRIRFTEFVAGMIAGASILAAGMMLGGAGQQAVPASPPVIPEVIKARRFEIVDDLGTVLLAAGTNKDGGSISVRDRFGKPLVLAAATEHGGTLVVSGGSAAQPVFTASAAPAGGGAAHLFNAEGKSVFNVACNANGAAMKIADENGHTALTLQATESNGGTLTAASNTGATSMRLFSNIAGGGVIETYRANGSPLVTISATEGGHGQVSTFAGLAKPLVTLTATANHEGQIYTYNEDGQTLIALASRPGDPGAPTLRVFNTHGEAVATLESDNEGNGVVGVYRRDGSGRTLAP